MAETPPSIPRRTQKKPKRPPVLSIVRHAERLTPNMQRIVFDTPLSEGPTDRVGANLKLVLPGPNTDPAALHADPTNPDLARIFRTYTVAALDPANGTMTIDFALHNAPHGAPAADWARTAKPGDKLLLTPPGLPKLTEFFAESYLLAADMTAIPAIAAILDRLPPTAKGHAIFEISDEADRQFLPAPKGITQHWILAGSEPDQRALAASLPLTDTTQIAAAGEHSTIAALKALFFTDRGIDPATSYASPYWKIGLVEEEHQSLKRAEAEAATPR